MYNNPVSIIAIEKIITYSNAVSKNKSCYFNKTQVIAHMCTKRVNNLNSDSYFWCLNYCSKPKIKL
jgi:hypothetical protein